MLATPSLSALLRRRRFLRRAYNLAGMESSTPTGEVSPSPPETPLSPLPVARERCAMCGATLAADQRYCVECGQRCGPSRIPFTDGLTQAAKQTSSSSEPRSPRARPSVNATLIAGIGTLLLALGVGVLIGREGASTSNSKTPAVQVVTVAGGGGTGAAAATGGAESQQTSSAAAKTAATGAAAAKAAKAAKPAVPPTKVVKVGSKGSGPGYQHGHFTGNFFGE